MSTPTRDRRLGVRDIRKGGGPYVCLTAYTTPMARLLDPHVDLLLVGDSLGMVLYGMLSTLSVTLDMMVAHGAAVMRGTERACVIVDLPFGSYGASPEQAFRSAARVLAETGCAGVKLEGGAEMAETVRFLVRRGIPVCGHVGLMPQAVNASGFRAQGRDEAEAARVAADARAVAEAGAFAVVLEGTYEPVARAITGELPVPTIGIGASPACDGQILVTDDVLGLFADFTPRFVKRYAELGAQVSQVAAAYAADVRARRFPEPRHCFGRAKTNKRRPAGLRPPSPGDGARATGPTRRRHARTPRTPRRHARPARGGRAWPAPRPARPRERNPPRGSPSPGPPHRGRSPARGRGAPAVPSAIGRAPPSPRVREKERSRCSGPREA